MTGHSLLAGPHVCCYPHMKRLQEKIKERLAHAV